MKFGSPINVQINLQIDTPLRVPCWWNGANETSPRKGIAHDPRYTARMKPFCCGASR